MQCAAIEFARQACGLERANSTEIDPTTPHPVIYLMPEQLSYTAKGGTMRLGAYECELAEGSRARGIYGEPVIRERHRHRYEYNNDYKDRMGEAGMRFSGICPQNGLVEVLEIPDHPWFVGVQFHPELRSRPRRPHPLFASFVGAAVRRREERKADA
jgi:CTP synthase